MDNLLKVTENFALTPNVIISAVVAVVAVVLWVLLGRLKRKFLKSLGMLRSDKGTIVSVTFYIVRLLTFAFAVLFILQINGINVTSLIAGLGVFGAVLGLAGKDLVTDMIMGYHILTDKSFGVGDAVKYGEYEGIVTDFNLKATKIKTFDENNTVTVCNRNITEVKKLSDSMYLEVPMPYSTEYSEGCRIAGQICEEINKQTDISGCEFLGVKAFGASQIVYLLLVKSEPQKRLAAHRAANGCIMRILADNGIAIPFEQLDVHIDKAEA